MNERMNQSINQMKPLFISEEWSLHGQWVLCVPLILRLILCYFVVSLQYQLILAYHHQRFTQSADKIIVNTALERVSMAKLWHIVKFDPLPLRDWRKPWESSVWV